MGGNESAKNLINLSYEDHYNSHIILANCFEKHMVEHGKNISSSKMILASIKRILTKRGIDINNDTFFIQASKQMKDLFLGENNPFYGKRHTDETKLAIGKKNKNKLLGENNPMYGKTHTETAKQKISDRSKLLKHSAETRNKMSESSRLYRESIEGKIEIKHRLDNFSKWFGRAGKSDEHYKKMIAASIAKRARKCIIYGIEYESIASAARQINNSEFKIKQCIKINKSKDCYYV